MVPLVLRVVWFVFLVSPSGIFVYTLFEFNKVLVSCQELPVCEMGSAAVGASLIHSCLIILARPT